MTKGALPLFGPEEGGALSSGNRDPRRAYDARLTTAGVDPEVDVASEFLLKTLVKRVVVREVGGVAFMTARTWRAPVKDLQIKSLRILKQSLPPRFVEEAGRDLAAAARKLNGDRAFSFVVPVPCGHSGREDCFSYRLGDQTRDANGGGTVRTLTEQVALETRTRMLNPKWYEGMLKHGYEGVRQIEVHLTNTMGWSATTGQVQPWVYQQLSETFMLDPEMRERLAKLNPTASARVANRLLEASERKFWTPDAKMLEALRRAGEELEDRLEGVFSDSREGAHA